MPAAHCSLSLSPPLFCSGFLAGTIAVCVRTAAAATTKEQKLQPQQQNKMNQ